MHVSTLPVSVVMFASLVAAATDLRQFKIYNILTLPLIASGILYYAAGGGWAGLVQSAVGASLAAMILFVPYLCGALGGGDLKLMVGVGAWLGAPWTVYVLLASSIASGAYAVALVLRYGGYRRLVQNVQVLYYKLKALGTYIGPEEDIEAILTRQDRYRRAIPFGAMVAVGVVMVAWWTNR
jgi:prepilin peptidase CpaA